MAAGFDLLFRFLFRLTVFLAPPSLGLPLLPTFGTASYRTEHFGLTSPPSFRGLFFFRNQRFLFCVFTAGPNMLYSGAPKQFFDVFSFFSGFGNRKNLWPLGSNTSPTTIYVPQDGLLC